jgi:putative ABC transport system permease protein
MNASFRYVLRNLNRRRLRTVAGAAGIFLTLALLTAIRVGLDSVSTSYTDLVALQAGKADLVITARGGHLLRPEAFDPDLVRARLEKNAAIRGLAPRWAGLVQLRSDTGTYDAFLIGVDPRAERDLDLWGLHPTPLLEGRSCALSQALAKRLMAGAGAGITARAGSYGEEANLKVEAVFDRQLILPQEIREFLVVNEATARMILAEPQRVHQLAGTFQQPAAYYDSRDLHASVLRLKQAGEAIAAELGTDFEVRLPKAAAITMFQNVASPLQAVFGIFAVLALAVTGLLVYSIVSVAVEERIREYAILRTVGARRGDIFRLVLGESVFLCCLGVVPGVLAGTLAAKLIVTLVELAMRAQVGSVTLAWSSSSLWLMLAAGSVLSIGSALIPALQATRRRIVDALDPLRRGQIQASADGVARGTRPLFLTGLALSLLSVVVFFVLPTAFLSGNSSMIGTVVLCLLLTILLGFTLVALGSLPWIERAVMTALGWVLGPAVELARRNLERHRRRNTTTALMFVLSISLVIFVASLVVLLSRMSMTMVEHFNGADIKLQSDAHDAKGLKPDLLKVAGVNQVSEVRFLRGRSDQGTAYDVVASDLVGMKHLWLVPFGVDADLPRVLFTRHIRYAEGGDDALARLANYVAAESNAGTNSVPPVILSQSVARFLEVHKGDQIQLAFHIGAERHFSRFRVDAICETLPGFDNFRARVANAIGSGVLIPVSCFRELTGDAPEEAVLARYFLKVDGGEAEQKAIAQTIQDRFELRFRFGVKSALEQKQQARILYWTTQVFFGLLLTVAVATAVFALIASMATAAIERRWEIGMLKALGLRRSQLFRMFLAEALGLTLSAGVAGGAIGFALAWFFVLEAGALAEIPVVFTMPYLTFLATFAISVAAGAIAAHLPTRRLLRKTAAEILRQDL